jgi:hypothetical protein
VVFDAHCNIRHAGAFHITDIAVLEPQSGLAAG